MLLLIASHHSIPSEPGMLLLSPGRIVAALVLLLIKLYQTINYKDKSEISRTKRNVAITVFLAFLI
jgi:hypothetical protein